MAKEPICVKVEPAMKARIQIVANREGRSTADVCRNALLFYIEQHINKYGKISEAETNQIQLFNNKKGE